MPSPDRREINEDIKSRLPIEEVVGSYVPLRKTGRIMKALCPFHNEKTPSFTVNPERGIFKCFGCGEGGDIFDFVMKLEGLSFPEAVELLAGRAGVPLPEWKPEKSDTPKGPSKVRLLQLNAAVARLWHRILTDHPKTEAARAYLQGRSITMDTIKAFEIGYAPLGNATTQKLREAGFTAEELHAAGDPGRFQDRIIFPICDLTGKPVGFTGRLLESSDDTVNPNKSRQMSATAVGGRGPKYWNTPETPLFVKSRVVYALHLAKHAIQEKGVAILAEGQMDVITLHQFGYHNTVASSGTALTADQLRLIGRFTTSVAFAYDQDKAGKEATRRGIELALAAELTPSVITVPVGKDPAECLERDPEAWERAYQERKGYMEWLLSETLPQGNTGLTTEKKKQAAGELIPWLTKMTDPTEQSDWFLKLAAHLQTDEQNLRELYRRAAGKPLAAPPRAESTAQPDQKTKETSLTQLAETAMALIWAFPDCFELIQEQLPTFEYVSQPGQIQRQLMPILMKKDAAASLEEAVHATMSDQERTAIDLLVETRLKPYEDIEGTATWALGEVSTILRRIREAAHEDAKGHIAASIKSAQALGNTEEVKRLFQELQNLV